MFTYSQTHQQSSPPYFLKSLNNKRIDQTLKDLDNREGETEKSWLILCRYCQHEITSEPETIEVKGKHGHTYYNPEGIIYNIGCFAIAQGCTVYGKPTYEFTWFPGFNWRFAICANCRVHLGWHYQSVKEGSFFGLIVNKLIRPP